MLGTGLDYRITRLRLRGGDWRHRLSPAGDVVTETRSTGIARGGKLKSGGHLSSSVALRFAGSRFTPTGPTSIPQFRIAATQYTHPGAADEGELGFVDHSSL
jgi:hypothetical protein